MNIPENLPILSKGAQSKASGKMCAEQAVSQLAGEDWTDKPECVQPVLNSLTIAVNDNLPDDQRYRMWPAILRQIGTSRPDMEPILSVRLAVFLAEQVLDLVRPQDREVCIIAIETAKVWCDCPCDEVANEAAYAAKEATYAANAATYATYAAVYTGADAECYAANAAVYNAADAAYAAKAAANTANVAANAAAYAANEANVAYAANEADCAAYAADYVANVAKAAVNAAKAVANSPDRLIKLLEDTQAECERLIGHIPAEIDVERLASLCEMGVTAAPNLVKETMSYEQ